jgi:hypothetical protein
MTPGKLVYHLYEDALQAHRTGCKLFAHFVGRLEKGSQPAKSRHPHDESPHYASHDRAAVVTLIALVGRNIKSILQR